MSARVLCLVAVALAIAAPGAPSASAEEPTGDEYARRVRALIDEERARHGLPPLAEAPCAQDRAESAVASLASAGRLRHPPLRELLRACDAEHGAENLGAGQATPEALLRSWLASARHRGNLLGARYTRLGVAATRSAGGRWYAVAAFVGD